MAPSPARRRITLLWTSGHAGMLNACATLVLVLTLGLLGLAPLGPLAPAVGIAAGFSAVIAGGLVYACCSRMAAPTSGPSSATALVFAGLAARLVQDPALDVATPAGLAALLAVLGVCVAGMGLLQVAMAALGLGRLAQYVPQPVLAGFMNGVALLILVSQVQPLLGLPASGHWHDAQLPTLGIGLSTAAMVWGLNRRWPRAPALLIGLLGGAALYGLLALAWPATVRSPLVGPLPDVLLHPLALAALVDGSAWPLLLRHGSAVAFTACVLALISALESMLSAVAIDQLTHGRHDGRRELLALGAANLASGVFGGLPLVLSRARATALIHAGSRGHGPVLASVPVLLALALAGGPLLALLPRTVLAGIMLTIALALIDRWSSQLLRQLRQGERSRELRTSLLLVAVVGGVTLWLGFVAAVALGLLLSLALFVQGMHRSLLRAASNGSERPSRRIYPPAQEALLQPLRRRITLLELEGALFFGSAERLATEADALPASCRVLVLDLRRVSTIDETGAVLLQQLSDRLRNRGVALALAGVTPENRHGRQLRTYGVFRGADRTDWHPDADRALEAAEALLLAEAGAAPPQSAMPLAQTALLQGLSPAQCARVTACLERHALGVGDLLFREGDVGDRLYVLTEGSVSILGGGVTPGQRYVSYSPGAIFGETAMLDGGGRSASAVADRTAVVHALSADALRTLAEQDPALGTALLRNVALHLSQRLRGADWAWRTASS